MHQQMLNDIADEVRRTAPMIGRDHLSPQVMNAMAEVPREAFVPREWRQAAYANRALPIGHGQTISQPYMVALMTDLLEIQPGHRVLEVGTGCGYQCAVLAHLAGQVISLEVLPALAERAREQLEQLGYHNVEVIEADGTRGWPEAAPYQGIIVTAAGPRIPPALIEQLAVGGRLVVPVGEQGHIQQLQRVIKVSEGDLQTETLLPVRFVPLTDPRHGCP